MAIDEEWPSMDWSMMHNEETRRQRNDATECVLNVWDTNLSEVYR
jgi:hypothetical protein